MPKGGGKGGTNSKKSKPLQDHDEGSNIVFEDDKPKKGKKNLSKDDEEKNRNDGHNGQDQDAPKKPDTRQLIGGASWTGKLPVNLLSEHCQKQKWAKPEYTMSKTANGFSSSVILKSTDPKTREVVALPPFVLPPAYKDIAFQSSAVEARHFAATYALFRVCNMRNIHMMLPPTYRDLWKTEFERSKKEDVAAGRAWLYAADPFVAQSEQDEAHNRAAQKRVEDAKRREQEKRQPTAISLHAGTNSTESRSNDLKGWKYAPKLDLGKQIRLQIETLVRRCAIWNPHGLEFSQAQVQLTLSNLTRLGFRKSHVEEAVEECKDSEETLEWLLIHVPEDDLPTWSLPEGYNVGISMASGNLKREAAIKRLAQAGYSTDLCSKTLDEHAGSEELAAQALQEGLAIHSEPDVSNLSLKESIANLSLKESIVDSSWTEEKETLKAIFGERCHILQESEIEIHVALQNIHSCTLRVRVPKAYPQIPPVMAIVSKLPAYIRLSVLRQLLEYAESNTTGEPMIFQLVDWLEIEIPRIIQNPGKLRNVSAALTGLPQSNRGLKSTSISSKAKPSNIDWRIGTPASMSIYGHWLARQELPEQQKMVAARQILPAWKQREAIVNTVNQNQVTIISGETGSGKSTQAVQFILDDMIERKQGASANIVCTQPRRISALGLADRVSNERCSAVGNEIGYAIRGESKSRPSHTRIIFVTTGVLLRRLQTSRGHKNDTLHALADVSHVVVDEVHERSLDTDFLLVLLRNILAERRDLKVILMSATLDASIFELYFGRNASVGKIQIEGRTFPVEDFYLDDILQETGFVARTNRYDSEELSPQALGTNVANTIQSLGMRINYDLIASCVKYIDEQMGMDDGGILIFLPGVVEISRTLDVIRRLPDMHALPLHAGLLPNEQRRVFPPAPRGKRKIIAATNVAETSITIEDIVAVIDCGKVKETSFDPQNNMVRLEEVWASRAACKQRRGRAGRVQAGQCYKLFTRNAEAKMAERPEPEIKRVPLEQLCLSVKAMGVADVSDFLSKALTPPESTAVDGAIKLLHRMGALESDQLTALGQHLSIIPVDLRCGKLMVYGATFGCFEACLTVAAILTAKCPFVSPQDKREESKAARTSFAPQHGDLICDLQAFAQWAQLKNGSNYRDMRQWCEAHFLSAQTLNDISMNRSQYLSSLQDAGFVPPDYRFDSDSASSLNQHNGNLALIRALIAGAFNPQLARIDFPDRKFAPSVSGTIELDPEAKMIKYFNQENGRVFVHPSSTLFDAQGFVGNAVYMSYFNKMATSKTFIRELTPCNAYAMLLFGGPIMLDTLGRGVVVDGWLKMRGWARIGVLVNRLRMMVDDVLARKIEDPSLDISGSEVIGVVRKLVEFDGMDR
ncbi:MAG: hypothetical protein Q9220_000721 [cf. Caloplaca sp. 1 TL-2023]